MHRSKDADQKLFHFVDTASKAYKNGPVRVLGEKMQPLFPSRPGEEGVKQGSRVRACSRSTRVIKTAFSKVSAELCTDGAQACSSRCQLRQANCSACPLDLIEAQDLVGEGYTCGGSTMARVATRPPEPARSGPRGCCGVFVSELGSGDGFVRLCSSSSSPFPASPPTIPPSPPLPPATRRRPTAPQRTHARRRRPRPRRPPPALVRPAPARPPPPRRSASLCPPLLPVMTTHGPINGVKVSRTWPHPLSCPSPHTDCHPLSIAFPILSIIRRPSAVLSFSLPSHI